MADLALTVEDSLLYAYANYKLKNFDVMLEFTESALTMRPDFGLALHYKALALRGLGDMKGAEKAVKEAINRDPGDFRHIFLLGIIEWNQGDMQAAEENLKKSINYLPNEAYCLIEYATFLIHRGRFEEALDAAYKAKSIDSTIDKLKDVINSARQKEFKEGIDILSYIPPFPYDTNLNLAHLKLGDYYLENSYLSNAQVQYLTVLKEDDKNQRAKIGFATATRLKEGGMYQFGHAFSRFVLQKYVLGFIGFLIIFVVISAIREPFIKDLLFTPYMIGGGGLTLLMAAGLGWWGAQKKSASDYERILLEWEVLDAEGLKKKIETFQSARFQKQLEQEAVLNEILAMVNYSKFASLLGIIALVSQMFVVNIKTAGMTGAQEDTFQMIKQGLLVMMILCFSVAVFYRFRSRTAMAELQGKDEEEDSKKKAAGKATRR